MQLFLLTLVLVGQVFLMFYVLGLGVRLRRFEGLLARKLQVAVYRLHEQEDAATLAKQLESIINDLERKDVGVN